MEGIKNMIDGQVQDLEKIMGVKGSGVNEYDSKRMTALHYAAWYNKKELMQGLLDRGADPNIADGAQSTPLHYAARYRERNFQTATGEIVTSESSREVIKILLKNGAQVNASNETGDTPLSMAVIRGNEEAVHEILDTVGLDLETSDKRGWTAMHYAAKFERLSIGKLLIEQGAKTRATTERKGTPLMLAAAEGNLHFVNLLLDSCLNDEEEIAMVNDETVDGESPLDCAVESKRKKIVELLIQRGAKVMKTCRSTQMSPLHLTSISGGPRIVQILLEKEPGLLKWVDSNQATPLHLAVQQGRLKITNLLLDSGANLEARDHENFTPLLTAVVHGEEKVLNELLSRGANVTALSTEDQSVIHLAAMHDRTACIEILLQHIKESVGLKERIVSADDKLGNSPLHLAAEKGYTAITQILLDNGADIENINEQEETPLHVASKCGKTGIVKAILQSTTDQTVMNSTQEEGDTPLHLAAAFGHVKVVEALLEAGAGVDIRNRQFWTPLACAASHGFAEVVALLHQEEAEIAPRDRTMRTPLQLAAITGHPSVLELLLKLGASVADRDKEGSNALDLAIQFNQKSSAMAIVQSRCWKDALRNRTPGTKAPFTTPLRKLMKKMPEVVEKVFDNCVNIPHGLDVKDPDLEIRMNFEFLDDTYTCAAWGDRNLMHVPNNPQSVYGKEGILSEFAKPYTDDSHIREANHPLQTLVDYKCGDLLYHPLVLGLVRHKWRLAKLSYFSFLLFYATFVAVFTWNMVAQKPPFYYNRTLLELSKDNDSMCEDVYDSVQESLVDEPEDHFFIASAVIQWIMCGLGITMELLQLYSTPARYFSSPTNLFDWFTYVAVLITLIPVHPCYIATDWQWQLGTSAMFVAWMNLILFLRRLPGVGIYVVMVGVICTTFFKFFVFCFSLFVFAFGFTFYVLLRNQVAFATPGYAFVKTGVMMIGEIEFEGLFHGDDDDFGAEMYYEGITYTVFMLFICIATIIIMNLLTGLAVGDVQEIQEHARIKKLAMQIELALDVEVGLTEDLRRYFQCVVGQLHLRPNKLGRSFTRKLGHFLSGPLSSKSIAEAMYIEVEELAEEEAAKEDDEHVTQEQSKIFALNEFQQHVMTEVEQSKEQMKSLETKIDVLESMMRKLLEVNGVEITDA